MTKRHTSGYCCKTSQAQLATFSPIEKAVVKWRENEGGNGDQRELVVRGQRERETARDRERERERERARACGERVRV